MRWFALFRDVSGEVRQAKEESRFDSGDGGDKCL